MGSENYPQKYPKLPPDATGHPRTTLEETEVTFPRRSGQNWIWMGRIGLLIGAGNRSRTYDLRITNALLYQLSYSGFGTSRRAAGRAAGAERTSRAL